MPQQHKATAESNIFTSVPLKSPNNMMNIASAALETKNIMTNTDTTLVDRK
jgi:hypothetical protein